MLSHINECTFLFVPIRNLENLYFSGLSERKSRDHRLIEQADEQEQAATCSAALYSGMPSMRSRKYASNGAIRSHKCNNLR